jgi:hypothetical protein
MCLIIWKLMVCCCVILCSLVAVCLLSPKLLMMKAVDLYEMSVCCNQTMYCDIPKDNICLWEHQISHSNDTVHSVQFHPSSVSLYFHVRYKCIVYRNYQTYGPKFYLADKIENVIFFSGTTALVRPWPPPLYSTGWHSASIVYGFKHELFFMWMAGVISPMPQPPTWWTRVHLFVWELAQTLCGMVGPTMS